MRIGIVENMIDCWILNMNGLSFLAVDGWQYYPCKHNNVFLGLGCNIELVLWTVSDGVVSAVRGQDAHCAGDLPPHPAISGPDTETENVSDFTSLGTLHQANYCPQLQVLCLRLQLAFSRTSFLHNKTNMKDSRKYASFTASTNLTVFPSSS